ncbi:hypothetical protein F7725_004874 [Dissostichus mawsoni]|uniref:Uncharacterized protein n=1 Tax=Dissostichus mawsoni TaxID=36200 RepID=A0A7J5XKA7_DISMA|nr:hypothetical protein F7725_004874 [Dissostichus mawsoni]
MSSHPRRNQRTREVQSGENTQLVFELDLSSGSTSQGSGFENRTFVAPHWKSDGDLTLTLQAQKERTPWIPIAIIAALVLVALGVVVRQRICRSNVSSVEEDLRQKRRVNPSQNLVFQKRMDMLH